MNMLQILVLARFLHANRYPLRLKTLYPAAIQSARMRLPAYVLLIAAAIAGVMYFGGAKRTGDLEAG